MSHAPARRRGAAFTLIELIAAIVVLSVAVPPMLWALQEAQYMRADTILAVDARWLASEQLEAVLADRYSTTRGYDHCVSSNYPAQAAVSGWPALARTVSIVETGADLVSPGTGYKTVTVTVSWTATSGDLKNLALATVITEPVSP